MADPRSATGEGEELLEQVRAEVGLLRRKHDDMRHASELKKDRIKVLRDHLDRIDHQRKIAQEDLPHAGEMQELEAAIKEQEHRLEEADEQRLMYLQMINRLKGESAFFNRDLSKVKIAGDAKEQDEIELQLIHKEASNKRDGAKQRHSEFEHVVHAEHRRRARELVRREKQLEKRRDQCAEHEVHIAERRRELMVAQEQALASLERTIKNPSTVDEELAQIAYYEDEFKQIQNVAGASEVQDIISKFLRQEDTYNMLSAMSKDSHRRIGATKEAKAAAHAAVERFRYEGVGQPSEKEARHGPSSPYLSFEDSSLAASPVWSAHHDARLQRTTRNLIEVRAGVQHLLDLLASTTLELEDYTGSLETGEQLLESLEFVARNVLHLLQSTSDPIYEARARADVHNGDDAESGGQLGRMAPRPASTWPEQDEVFLLTTKLDNFRLDELNEEDEDDEEQDDDDNELVKNAVLSSVDVKGQAERLILRYTKPKRRLKGKAAQAADAPEQPVAPGPLTRNASTPTQG